ncbi:hypothetical protein M422DRAFT_66549 [Sphaerobolus stellatus SS14]|nr:hypothetical protein M422DRAFT_66549 [Sphaerobolus stellatus SS14]
MNSSSENHERSAPGTNIQYLIEPLRLPQALWTQQNDDWSLYATIPAVHVNALNEPHPFASLPGPHETGSNIGALSDPTATTQWSMLDINRFISAYGLRYNGQSSLLHPESIVFNELQSQPHLSCAYADYSTTGTATTDMTLPRKQGRKRRSHVLSYHEHAPSHGTPSKHSYEEITLILPDVQGYRCKECHQCLSTPDDAQNHVKAEHPKSAKFRCTATGCRFITAWPSAARRHCKEQSEAQSSSKCANCGNKYTRGYYAKREHKQRCRGGRMQSAEATYFSTDIKEELRI